MSTSDAAPAQDVLIEIGTEELPPKALPDLSRALTEGLVSALQQTQLGFTDVHSFATPRRLAVRICDMASAESDREVLRRGPALAAAFDQSGNPTSAARGFAGSCGVDVSELERLENEQGCWLAFRKHEPGRRAADLLPEMLASALAGLPIPKRMRWGSGSIEFVRPVHWVVLLIDGQVLDAEILGIRTTNRSRGHRFHAPGNIEIPDPRSYESILEHQGRVLVSFDERRSRIRGQVEACASRAGGIAMIDAALLDEVTALVEWPVALVGSFDERFLELPREVLVATMKDHQRYFPLLDGAGDLLPKFIAIANIESAEPAAVRAGNERVIRPRLADAEFFWNQDRADPLIEFVPRLKSVIYQAKLGSLYDRTIRVQELSASIAAALGGDVELARRAAYLSRADLMSDMVAEFPELQGIMGNYYAKASGEDDELARAIEEMYRPRFAGDALPETTTGQVLAIADKLDALIGIFGIGQAPTGDKDPYALRRAAVGVLRILVEGRLDLDIVELLECAAAAYGDLVPGGDTVGAVFDFMLERLRTWNLDRGVAPDVFEAVAAGRPRRPWDFERRLQAVSQFRKLPAAASLAAANKRIGNILKKAEWDAGTQCSLALLQEPAEKRLWSDIEQAEDLIAPLIRDGDYALALEHLAQLREDVDQFFDDVLVMCDDEATRVNRLALLSRLRGLFMRVADISKLHS